MPDQIFDHERLNVPGWYAAAIEYDYEHEHELSTSRDSVQADSPQFAVQGEQRVEAER